MRLITGCAVLAVIGWLFSGWWTGQTAESITHVPAAAVRVEQEPYGGCDEAYLYPGTEGAQWCEEHGLPKIKVDEHNVLVDHNLPPCANDEPAGGPCLWDALVRGNGYGNSFWLDEHDQVHYLWTLDPTQGDGAGSWEWVTQELGDALAEGPEDDATTRDWESCVRSLTDGPLYVWCPDGAFGEDS